MLSLCWGKCETLATSHDTHPHCVTLKYIYPVPNRWTDFEPRVTWLMTTEHPLNMRRYLSHGPEPEDHCFPRLSWPQCRDFMFNAHHSNHFQFTTITTLKCKLNALHVRLPSFWATYFAELWQIYHNRHCVADIGRPVFQRALLLSLMSWRWPTVHCSLLTALSLATDWHPLAAT